MAVDIKVPPVGESVTEGRIARWLKPDGASVRQDEPLFELETDKATQEVAAPAAGTLKIAKPEGSTVAIGSVVGSIAAGAPAHAPAADSKPAPASQASPPLATPVDAPLSPAARRVAEERKLDPAALTGTGRGGLVTKEDALKAAPAPAASNGTAPAPAPVAPPPPPAPAPVPSGERVTRQRMSTIRQRIAERLVQSQQSTASLTTFNEVDMTAVMDLRNAFKDKFKEKHKASLGFMSFFVKACIEALKAFPMANARIDGADIVQQHFYDIGVAVSTERGLMVPVLRDADDLSFAQIESKIVELATKARDGKISVSDLSGGTFTITNGGVFGSMLSTPILNAPQTAILGMHAINKRPVVVNDQIVIRPMMYLALTYDHRLIDGREAVQFLVRVKECLEQPQRMLLDV